ncbi:MAG: S-layer homology domain-containing protein, partial [Bacillota bacterium]|nr:S-layer homology domain-containing protein [Bacillota bacterium]
KGMGEKKFMPEAELTREQMASIMMEYVRTMNLKLADLEEEKVFEDEMMFSDWAKKAIKMMQKAGILSGRDEKHFDAKGQASRAELAKILRKLAELN